jgi:hypothetical protein
MGPALAASDGVAGDSFGYAVAIGAGEIIAGAPAAGGSGAAYTFTLSGGGTWAQQQKLVPPDPTGSDWFGGAVAFSGSIAAIGAYNNGLPSSGPGTLYAFTSNGTQWATPPQEVKAQSSGQDFGYSVAVSGTTVAVGAIGASNDSGEAYVFVSRAQGVPAIGRTGTFALTVLLGMVGVLGARRRLGMMSS